MASQMISNSWRNSRLKLAKIQTSKHIFSGSKKHLAVPCFFNPLLGVWKLDKMLFFALDILLLMEVDLLTGGHLD